MSFFSKSLQALDKEFIYKHELQYLAKALLIDIKEVFLANILITKKQASSKIEACMDSLSLFGAIFKHMLHCSRNLHIQSIGSK